MIAQYAEPFRLQGGVMRSLFDGLLPGEPPGQPWTFGIALATDADGARVLGAGSAHLRRAPRGHGALLLSGKLRQIAINNSATKESRHDLGIGDCLGIDLEQILVQHDEIREFTDFNGSDQLFLKCERSTTRSGGPGQLPARASHRSGRARLTHPALQVVDFATRR